MKRAESFLWFWWGVKQLAAITTTTTTTTTTTPTTTTTTTLEGFCCFWQFRWCSSCNSVTGWWLQLSLVVQPTRLIRPSSTVISSNRKASLNHVFKFLGGFYIRGVRGLCWTITAIFRSEKTLDVLFNIVLRAHSQIYGIFEDQLTTINIPKKGACFFGLVTSQNSDPWLPDIVLTAGILHHRTTSSARLNRLILSTLGQIWLNVRCRLGDTGKTHWLFRVY